MSQNLPSHGQHGPPGTDPVPSGNTNNKGLSNSLSAPTSVHNTDANNALSSFSSNRAVTALKATSTATGALARLGKAIYSGGGSVLGGNTANIGHRDHTVEFDLSTANSSLTNSVTPPKPGQSMSSAFGHQAPSRSVKYQAKSSIIAMANSNTINSRFVAIAGQDFFEVLDVSDAGISVSRDMRPAQSNERQFDKVFAVTALQWGFDSFSSHIALSNSGGDILVYDVNHHTAKKTGSTIGGGSLVTQMKESTRIINSLAFSNSSPSTFISGNSDGIVRLWDLRQPRRPVLNFVKNGDNAREVKFRPWDSRKFAAIYDSGVIQRWDIRQPNNVDRRINAHASVGLSLDWHPDLDYLVSGGRDQQIQVWNMSGEYRTPDYVIQTTTAVAKVRWGPLQNRSNSITDSAIASSGRGKDDYKCYVWNLNRHHVPVYALEDHESTVTEIEFCRNKTIRSASKDGVFIQHDLLAEPKVLENLSSQAVAWLPLVGPTFVLQSKEHIHEDLRPRSDSVAVEDGVDITAEDLHQAHPSRRKTGGTPSSSFVRQRQGTSVSRNSSDKLYDYECDSYQTICDITLPTSDPQSFAYLAHNYAVFVDDEGSTLSSVFLDNAETAAKAFKFRTARTWEIIGQAIAEERKLFESRLEQGLIKLPTVRADAKTLSEPRDRNSLSQFPVLTGIPSKSRSRSRGPDTKLSREAPRNERRGSTGWSSNISDKSLNDDGDSEDERPGPSLRAPMAIPAGNVSRSLAVLEAKSGSNSSHDDVYGGLKGQTGQSYTHLTMGGSHSSHTDYNSDLSGTPNVGIRLDSFVGSYPSAQDSLQERHREHTSTAESISGGTDMDDVDGPTGSFEYEMGMEEEHRDRRKLLSNSIKDPAKDPVVLRSLYLEFLQTLNHPWRSQMLIKKAVEFAIGRGDVQFCVTIASLCGDIYSDAFPSTEVVEEWTVSYVLLLQKARQFVAAAEIVKYTNIQLIKDMGLTDTSFDPMCEYCKSPLRENSNSQYIQDKADVGFWYCQSCQRVLSGCILCNSPIKGRAVAFFDCGHRVHANCIKSWLFDENMIECPAGCGNIVVSQV